VTGAIAVGATVVVRSGPPEGHCRTPFYLRGKRGRIVGEFGSYRDPALLAFHKPGLPKRRLLRIAFRQRDVWPDYAGPESDLLLADLYESWLTPADTDC
jgi:nitrile hydratase subunit beta